MHPEVLCKRRVPRVVERKLIYKKRKYKNKKRISICEKTNIYVHVPEHFCRPVAYRMIACGSAGISIYMHMLEHSCGPVAYRMVAWRFGTYINIHVSVYVYRYIYMHPSVHNEWLPIEMIAICLQTVSDHNHG